MSVSVLKTFHPDGNVNVHWKTTHPTAGDLLLKATDLNHIHITLCFYFTCHDNSPIVLLCYDTTLHFKLFLVSVRSVSSRGNADYTLMSGFPNKLIITGFKQFKWCISLFCWKNDLKRQSRHGQQKKNSHRSKHTSDQYHTFLNPTTVWFKKWK